MIKVVIFEIYASLVMLDVAMHLVVEGDRSSDIVKKKTCNQGHQFIVLLGRISEMFNMMTRNYAKHFMTRLARKKSDMQRIT